VFGVVVAVMAIQGLFFMGIFNSYEEGYLRGQKEGYMEGWKTGVIEGYDKGCTKCKSHYEQYTFNEEDLTISGDIQEKSDS